VYFSSKNVENLSVFLEKGWFSCPNWTKKQHLYVKPSVPNYGVDFLAIENGNVVKMHYEAKLGDRVIDTSRNGDPLEFKVGGGYVIQGLDEALVGLETGEKKTVVVPPEKAYGKRKAGFITKIPRNKSNEPEKGIKAGNIIRYNTETGEVKVATVTKVEDDNITLDLNHPLAGQTLTFDLEIIAIK
jgi:peptidylprolyl isomerase